MEKIGYIYGLIDPRTNEIFYIGKTIKPKTRVSNHMSKSNLLKNSTCCKYLKELKEQNLKPILKILCTCKSNNMNKLEKKYICIYRKINPNLTNEREGGDGWNLNKKLPSSNWKNAIAAIKKPVTCRNIKTGEEITYSSIAECSEKTGVHKVTISSILTGKRNKSAKGFYFRYAEQQFIEPKNNYKFISTNIKTNQTQKYNSISELKQNNFDPSFIFAVCNGKRKSAYGCTWEKIIE